MLSVIISLVAVCACIVLWQRKRAKEALAHPLPPALFGELPIIGHGHLLVSDTKDLWSLIEKVSYFTVNNGGVVHGKLLSEIYYLISDPDDALTVANTCLQKHYMYSFLDLWLGQGLISSSGAVWQRHRKLLNPAFSLPVIHGFLEVFNSQSRQLVRNVEREVGKNSFDHSIHIKNIILGISCMTAFGDKDLKDKQFYSKYMKAVEEILHIVTQRFQKFWLHNDLMNKLLGLRKQEEKVVKTLHEMSNKIIRSKINSTNGKILNQTSTNISYKPFIDVILEQTGKDTLTEQEIREELDTTIAAGFETSAMFLEIAMVLIGSYPEVQEKMYKEVMDVIGADRDVEKNDLQKLVYTGAVIKESLRFLPIVPVVARYIDKEVKLKNYTLRAGTQCVFLTLGMHRHPSWGPDADQFKPERWLDTAMLPSLFNAFAAFSFGKRSCIGKTYALTSAKVTLAHLIRAYKITADYTKMKFKVDVTLKPVEGQEISLQRRPERTRVLPTSVMQT